MTSPNNNEDPKIKNNPWELAENAPFPDVSGLGNQQNTIDARIALRNLGATATSGSVTYLSKNSSQTVSNNSETQITFDTYTGNAALVGTNALVAQASGMVQIVANMNATDSSTSGVRQLILRKNGNIIFIQEQPGDGALFRASLVYVDNASAGDSYTISFYQNSGFSSSVSNSFTRFSMILL